MHVVQAHARYALGVLGAGAAVGLHQALAQKAAQGPDNAFALRVFDDGPLHFNKLVEALHGGFVVGVEAQLVAHGFGGALQGG